MKEIYIIILHDFGGDIPEYFPRGGRKALTCYVTRCRRQRALMLSKSDSVISEIEQIFKKPNTMAQEEIKSEKENPLCKRFFH